MPTKQPPKTPTPFETDDSEAAFKHFAAFVAKAATAPVEVYNADAEIVRVNVRRAVDAIRPHLAEVAEAMPRLDIEELLELPALGLALAFAADRVFTPASPQQVRARQATLRPARSLGLRMLEILGEIDLVPADKVRNIRAGRGPVDEARDAVAIVALFHEHEQALAGKHPFDTAFLSRLAEDGNWLLGQLTPSGATPERGEKSPEAVLRNKLWTELNRRYDELYKAGVEVWGRRRVDEHIPALQSRLAGSATAPAGGPPAGTPPGAPPPQGG